MTSETQAETPSAMHTWLAMLARFVGFVLVSTMLLVLFYGLLDHAPWFGYAAMACMAGIIGFPSLFKDFWGVTKNFPRILIVISLLPALLFSWILFISDSAKKAPVSPPAPAPAPVVAAPVAAKPAPAKKQEAISWAHNMLVNETSRVLLGATLSCNEYYVNKKEADSVKSAIDFTTDTMNVPLLPGESRAYAPPFKVGGNRDDVDPSLRQCVVSKVKFADEDDSVPIEIRLSTKRNKHYGNYNTVAALQNTSNKPLVVSKLRLACVIVKDRQRTDEENLHAIQYGIYDGNTNVHSGFYYPDLIARPYASEGETRLEIPANGTLDVRLYRKGGLFSSDEELSTVTEFTGQKCWIPD